MPRTTRREFVTDAALAAAFAATGLWIPETAQARIPRRPVGPGDKVRLGVIGVRSRGLDHLKGYVGLPDVEIVAIADVDKSVGEKAVALVEKATGKRPEYFQDLRKLLERKDIDAVSCAMPIHWHAIAASWAMKAGKDVYVEKPCCHNVSEGKKLVEVQKRTGRICQVGTQARSHKAIQGGIAYIHAGKLGKVSLSRGLCYKRRQSIGIKPDGVAPDGVDYDLWLGAAPKRDFNPNRFHYEWHWNFAYGAGDLGNQGIHQMDIARWALNQNRLPDGVQTLGGRFGYVDQGETPNTAVAVYDYPGAPLVFEVRGLPTDPLQGASIGNIVYGENGTVVFSSNYGKAVAFDKEGNVVENFNGAGNHFASFIAAVKSRKQSELAAPVLEGHLSSSLCHLGNVSYRLGEKRRFADGAKSWEKNAAGSEALERMRVHLAKNEVSIETLEVTVGRPLAFDSQKLKFKRDGSADQLLTREYRKGFEI